MSLWCKDAETGDRTAELQIFSLTLSQLSYRGLRFPQVLEGKSLASEGCVA